MFGLNKIIPVDSDYKFLNFRKNFYIASGIAIFLSLLLLFFKGLNLGIDFKGGTLIEVSTNNSSIGEFIATDMLFRSDFPFYRTITKYRKSPKLLL